MVLTLNDALPFGKYKGVSIQLIVSNINSVSFDYLSWWDKNVDDFKLSVDIKKVLKEYKTYLENVREEYRLEELSHKEEDVVPTKLNRCYDLPMDDKPLHYYL